MGHGAVLLEAESHLHLLPKLHRSQKQQHTHSPN